MVDEMKELVDDIIGDLTNTKNNIEIALKNHNDKVYVLNRNQRKEFVHVRQLILQDIRLLSELEYPITGSIYGLMKSMPVIDKAINSRAAN